MHFYAKGEANKCCALASGAAPRGPRGPEPAAAGRELAGLHGGGEERGGVPGAPAAATATTTYYYYYYYYY
eukprot:16115820-Heterocapsa_arctica.AAC.1